MVGALILMGLLFRFPSFNGLSTQLTTGFEELFLSVILLLINSYYVHQPLYFTTTLTPTDQLSLGWPALLVAGYAAGVGVLSLKSVAALGLTLLVALLVSLFEELLFRGLIFKLLVPDFTAAQTTVLTGAALSSLLFSLTHLVNLTHQSWTLTLLQLLFTFAIGMLLCGLYQYTRSLWWPLAIHTLNDFFSFSQPTINLPLINTTTAFQLFEIIIIVILTVILFRTAASRSTSKPN